MLHMQVFQKCNYGVNFLNLLFRTSSWVTPVQKYQLNCHCSSTCWMSSFCCIAYFRDKSFLTTADEKLNKYFTTDLLDHLNFVFLMFYWFLNAKWCTFITIIYQEIKFKLHKKKLYKQILSIQQIYLLSFFDLYFL